MMNNIYEIEFKEPLCRPGVTIKTHCSEKYFKQVYLKFFELVREVNIEMEKNNK